MSDCKQSTRRDILVAYTEDCATAFSLLQAFPESSLEVTSIEVLLG